MSILGKMRQYGMAARLISLNNLEPVDKRMPVLMSFQFFRQIIIVEPLMPVIPQFDRSSVDFDVTVNVGAAVMERQNIVGHPDTGSGKVGTDFLTPVFRTTLPWKQSRQIIQQPARSHMDGTKR